MRISADQSRAALLHWLAAEERLRSWTRILLMVEVLALKPYLSAASDRVTLWPSPLDAGLAPLEPPRGGFQLILSVEQLNGRLAQPEVFAELHKLLAPGGMLALIAPLDVEAKTARADGPIDWDVMDGLTESRFSDVWV